MKKPFPWSRVGLHFVWYAVDLAVAIAAWVIGFGLTVKNWPALIAIGLCGRFVFHILGVVMAHERAREQVLAELSASPNTGEAK